jgi:hypothetical protein
MHVRTLSLHGRRTDRRDRRRNVSFFVDGGIGGSSPSANRGRSLGRKHDQTASESAAAQKARETAAARQASGGDVRETINREELPRQAHDVAAR